MEEKGIVSAVDGDMAVVQIERREMNGCGCGATPRKQEETIVARNSCGARVNDKVQIQSNYIARKYRSTVQAAVSLGVCLAVITLGEMLFSRAGLAPSGPFAMAAGFAAGIAAYIAFALHYRKNPLPLSIITRTI